MCPPRLPMPSGYVPPTTEEIDAIIARLRVLRARDRWIQVDTAQRFPTDVTSPGPTQVQGHS